MTSTFPVDPVNGTIFEVQTGVLYQYDATVRAWIKLASASVLLPLATHVIDGAMSSADLQKLNRLMIPPPHSSITGNDCYTPFERGVIALVSGDDLINVEGSVSVQNIDQYGDHIAKDVPFQIHQHTYGFDFNLDLNNLVGELASRNQLKTIGPPGDTGDKGPTGDAGIDGILTGPQGEKGDQGTSPPCSTTIQTEVVQTRIKQGLKRALTDARVVVNPDNYKQFSLELDRQMVGAIGASAATFNVRQQKSSWVLAVASTAGAAQQVYYIDIEPVVESIHEKFLSEVDRLKTGYEDITQFWVQTMSDLFDEQKSALCCALEACQSRTNGVQLRQHMESVAATALPDANIVVTQRGEPIQPLYLPGTALWPSIWQPDLCGGRFETESVPFEETLVVDPIIHMASGSRATIILDEGIYSATIISFDAEINGQHYADLVMAYTKDGKAATARFLNKGAYSNLKHAKSAYEGLSLTFDHAGGEVGAYYHMLPTANVAGTITIKIRRERTLDSHGTPVEAATTTQSAELGPDESSCLMDVSQLAWYERGWVHGQCCGMVMEVYGQDYIIIKRSIGNDKRCGGGESMQTPCLDKFRDRGHPAFAWPTLDKQNFVALPAVDKVAFKFNQTLCDVVNEKIANGNYENPKGNATNIRQLASMFDVILFPTTL